MPELIEANAIKLGCKMASPNEAFEAAAGEVSLCSLDRFMAAAQS